ncbi:hypothetical protein JR321_gp052 [Escherichia phage anhysbys]|uniref:Uncharacterized protein n=1 Tax=Escherichia phage anhysbys TaxID=2696383 RepID=A0A6B9XHI6_9CAUD|nr:hypothetical protein JR321_gp052 [Escherichia phage anhysbys]QHR75948.1 hypothetical protein anhysbys_52 [Escherichia phage anhysbys]
MRETIVDVVINGQRYVPVVEKAEPDALDVVFEDDDLGTVTVREYFRRLLSTLWEEEDNFSGKRPFGNSCWQFDLIIGLIDAGYLEGKVYRDEDGGIEDTDYDREEADKLIQGLIARMCLG